MMMAGKITLMWQIAQVIVIDDISKSKDLVSYTIEQNHEKYFSTRKKVIISITGKKIQVYSDDTKHKETMKQRGRLGESGVISKKLLRPLE